MGFWTGDPVTSPYLLFSVTSFSNLSNWHHHSSSWKSKCVCLRRCWEYQERSRLPKAIHGRTSPASAPPGPWGRASSHCFQIFLFQNWSSCSCIQMLQPADAARTTEVSERAKAVGVVGDENNFRQTESFISYIKTCYSICVLLKGLDIPDQKLEKNHMYSRPWSSRRRTPCPQNKHWHPVLQGSHVRLQGPFSKEQYIFQKIDPKFTYFFSYQGKTWEWNRQKWQDLG